MSTKFRKSFKNVIMCKPLNKNYSYVHKFFFKIPSYSMPNVHHHNLANNTNNNHNNPNNILLNKINNVANKPQLNKNSGNNQNESAAQRSLNKNERYD